MALIPPRIGSNRTTFRGGFGSSFSGDLDVDARRGNAALTAPRIAGAPARPTSNKTLPTRAIPTATPPPTGAFDQRIAQQSLQNQQARLARPAVPPAAPVVAPQVQPAAQPAPAPTALQKPAITQESLGGAPAIVAGQYDLAGNLIGVLVNGVAMDPQQALAAGATNEQINSITQTAQAAMAERAPAPPIAPTVGIPERGQFTAEDFAGVTPIGETVRNEIRGSFDRELIADLNATNQQTAAAERELAERGIDTGSPSFYLNAGQEVQAQGRQLASSARFQNTTARVLAIAEQVKSSSAQSTQNALRMIEGIDSANYDELPQMFSALLVPQLLEAGYTRQEIAGMTNVIAQSAWNDAVTWVANAEWEKAAESGVSNTILAGNVIRELMLIPYPNGTTPTRAEVINWLAAHKDFLKLPTKAGTPPEPEVELTAPDLGAGTTGDEKLLEV